MAADKIKITRENGEVVDAISPVIISASRSTDIPAFYSEWFFNRLKKGYCIWYNPFNQKPTYVSFKNTKAIVFWTKNPEPILKFLPELDKLGIYYYFQFTLNDYERENFEPNVPSLCERVKIFKRLAGIIGPERVIWRFDPLIVTPSLSPRNLLARIWHIGNLIKGCTNKLVFSFVDVQEYRKVQNNLVKETELFNRDNVYSAEMNQSQMTEVVEGLVKLRKIWADEGWKLEMATCAERIDLERYDISHNKCIDGNLLERLASGDKEFIYYLHTGELPECDLFGEVQIPMVLKNLKDKGQRKTCGCIASKDIGMYNTCRHLCIYCYANTSKEVVLRNQQKYNSDSESIIG